MEKRTAREVQLYLHFKQLQCIKQLTLLQHINTILTPTYTFQIPQARDLAFFFTSPPFLPPLHQRLLNSRKAGEVGLLEHDQGSLEHGQISLEHGQG